MGKSITHWRVARVIPALLPVGDGALQHDFVFYGRLFRVHLVSP